MAEWKSRAHLERHFALHGREVGARTVEEYDASAQETYRIGEIFGYEDRATGEWHVGYYNQVTGQFVATDENDLIVSHFVTDDDYVDELREEDT
jgi:hypothetical protein